MSLRAVKPTSAVTRANESEERNRGTAKEIGSATQDAPGTVTEMLARG